MKKAQTILSHANIVFGGTFLVLLLLNVIDPGLHFLSSGITNVFLLLFAFSAIALGVINIRQGGKRKRRKRARKAETAEASDEQ